MASPRCCTPARRRFTERLGALLLVTAGLVAPSLAHALSYVALGDSIAAGVGDNGPGGYVGRYGAYVASDRAVGVALQNLTVSGSTSQDLLTTLTTNAGVRAAVAAADLITLDIGGNDVLIGIFAYKGATCGGADGQDCLRQAVQTAGTNWPAIAAELRTLNPGAAIRTMSYYNPFVVDSAGAVVRTYTAALNAIIRETAGGYGIAVAEAAIAFNGKSGTEDPVPKGYIDADGIHPSPLGHATLATAFRALGYPPMAGTVALIPSSLSLKDDVVPPLDPSRRAFSFTASTRKGQPPASRVVLPPKGGPQDPTTAGATLTVYNASGLSLDNATVALPASGWSASGKGFRFTGTGPVRKALLAADKITLKAGGAAFDYSLDEPSQGAIAVRLSLGGGSWCASAPAKTSGTPPSTAKSDLPGKFVGRKNAPAPAVCPP
jgi:lysophospholipase L1-like esterase